MMGRMSPVGFPTYRRNTGLKTVFFIVALIFAVFFINYPFAFFKVPDAVMKYENWIVFVGGVLLLIGAIVSVTKRRTY
jgi:predicted membrane channel-forming protein YqfA (hemolysin III family)